MTQISKMYNNKESMLSKLWGCTCICKQTFLMYTHGENVVFYDGIGRGEYLACITHRFDMYCSVVIIYI